MIKKHTKIVCAAYFMAVFHASAGELVKKDYVNDLSGTVRRIIAVESDNIVNLDFPYEGDTRLAFVAWKEGGKNYINGDSEYTDAAFSLDRGQIACFKDVCRTRYKIDNGEVRALDFNIQSKDGSTRTAYVEDPYFLSKLRSAKQIVIEFPVYDNGVRTFTIDISVMNEALKNNLTKLEKKKKRASDVEDAKKEIKEIQKKLKDPTLTKEQREDLTRSLEIHKIFISI